MFVILGLFGKKKTLRKHFLGTAHFHDPPDPGGGSGDGGEGFAGNRLFSQKVQYGYLKVDRWPEKVKEDIPLVDRGKFHYRPKGQKHGFWASLFSFWKKPNYILFHNDRSIENLKDGTRVYFDTRLVKIEELGIEIEMAYNVKTVDEHEHVHASTA